MSKSGLLKFLIPCVLFVVVLEIGLRTLTDKYYTYIEKIGYGYISPYEEMENSWYHAYHANSVFENSRTEFSFSYNINELGIIDKPIGEIDSSKYKILCLGDSFTEGVGAPFDKSWPRLLANKLNSQYPDSMEVINGGVGGSDLFYSWKLFEGRLNQYDPDEIIFFIGISDLEDILIRGGDKRFLSDSSVAYKDPPWFEPLFQYSFLCRFIILEIMDYSFQLLSKDEFNAGISKSCQSVNEKLENIESFLVNKGIKMRVVIHPVSYEVKTHEYSYPCFNELARNLDVDRHDLLEEFNQAYNFDFENFDKYYWPIDNHFTEKGYELCADHIFNLYVQQ